MTNVLFGQAAQIVAGLAGVFALLTLITWIRGMRIRFAMVGYTGFLVVLAIGCFGLSLYPFMRTNIDGAVAYKTVYDRGANQAVISVPVDITPEALTSTLQQAAANLSSSGRVSTGSPYFTVRARIQLHPGEGITVPVYLGQLTQRIGVRQDPEQTIEIDEAAFAKAKSGNQG